MKKSGSQGQQKSFLLALKFAEFEILKSMLNFKPLFLIDDLFDKLDKNRVASIISFIMKKILVKYLLPIQTWKELN